MGITHFGLNLFDLAGGSGLATSSRSWRNMWRFAATYLVHCGSHGGD